MFKIKEFFIVCILVGGEVYFILQKLRNLNIFMFSFFCSQNLGMEIRFSYLDVFILYF